MSIDALKRPTIKMSYVSGTRGKILSGIGTALLGIGAYKGAKEYMNRQ